MSAISYDVDGRAWLRIPELDQHVDAPPEQCCAVTRRTVDGQIEKIYCVLSHNHIGWHRSHAKYGLAFDNAGRAWRTLRSAS